MTDHVFGNYCYEFRFDRDPENGSPRLYLEPATCTGDGLGAGAERIYGTLDCCGEDFAIFSFGGEVLCPGTPPCPSTSPSQNVARYRVEWDFCAKWYCAYPILDPDILVCLGCPDGADAGYEFTLSDGTGNFASANGHWVVSYDGTCQWTGIGGSVWSAVLTFNTTGGSTTATISMSGPGGVSLEFSGSADDCLGPFTMTLDSSTGTGTTPTPPTVSRNFPDPATWYLTEDDVCGGDFVIDSGPYDTEEEAAVFCDSSPITSWCCPGLEIPRTLPVRIEAPDEPTFDGVEFELEYIFTEDGGHGWGGQVTVEGWTLNINLNTCVSWGMPGQLFNWFTWLYLWKDEGTLGEDAHCSLVHFVILGNCEEAGTYGWTKIGPPVFAPWDPEGLCESEFTNAPFNIYIGAYA